MTTGEWTVDRLHHDLPHSASRQQLLVDVHMTPVDQLPAVLGRWAAAAETLQAAAGRIAAARAAQAVDAGEAIDRTDEILKDAGHRADRGAA